MTATDELRRLLDERGVEWRERKWGAKHSVTIFWRARGVRWHYRENQYGELRLHADGLSPAQAIDATLGRTCHMHDAGGEFIGYKMRQLICTSCGRSVIVSAGCEEPRYCQLCGAKVVDA